MKRARSLGPWLVAALGACATACEHEPAPKLGPPPAPQSALAPAAPERTTLPEYVIADTGPRGRLAAGLDLGEGARGAIIEGRRVVQRGTALHGAAEVGADRLIDVDRVPPLLGGGFLFRSRHALWVADTFDGPLRPLASLPADVYSVSFGPKGMLVRTRDGQRWMIDPRTGDRLPIDPPAVLDIAALGDGRAIAITEAGGAFASVDAGAHWTDLSRELTGSPATVFAQGEGALASLWLTQATGPALRLEPGGKIARVDPAPKSASPPRHADPRWHGIEPPLAVALRAGALVDAATAVVLASGDVVRVRLATGDIASVTPGRLPPDDACEAVRTASDVLFVCRAHAGSVYVVSHVLGDKTPVIEKTFLAPGRVFAGDDGALAFGGPCSLAKGSPLVACVRGADGAWRETDLETAAADGGAAPPAALAPFGDAAIVRWVPRGDGAVVALVDGKSQGVIDGKTGEARVWNKDAVPGEVKALLSRSPRHGSPRGSGEALVDRTWTMNEQGILEAWTAAGGGVAIDAAGKVTVSPFQAGRSSVAGPFGIAVSSGERVWQSVDHGRSWIEVASPPLGRTSGILARGCSAVGCDLGAWYRIGWPTSAPVPEPPPAVAPEPPRLARPALPELVCKPASETHAVSLPKGDRSPEDFGIGAMRLATGDNQVRVLFDRHEANPAHSSNGLTATSDYAAPRLLLFGAVADPERGAQAVRRQVAFVAPFDPGATVRKTSFSVADLVSRGRAVGMRLEDILGTDPTAVTGVAPVTSLDPAGTGDVVFLGATGAIGVLRTNPTTKSVQRIAMLARGGDALEPVSAVATSEGDVAVLALDSSGAGVVYRLGPLGVSEVFEPPAPPSPEVYPANADALAVGPKGELALLRTASGGDPPTAGDPAILIVPGARPVPLAPWSTLTSAEDEACKADPGGYRATVRTVAPWIRLTGELPEPDDDAPMLARVRWSEKRVCLEAVELRATDSAIGGDAQVESWVVAHLTSPVTAGRVSVVPGTEARQAMTCTLAAPSR